jgi:tRNA(fMet)-specific endonuclease VapC
VGLILDTSVLVATERRQLDLEALLRTRAPSDGVAISAVTLAELLYGVERAPNPAVAMRRAAFADWVGETLPVLPFGGAEARRHAALRAHLTATGAAIGPHDLQIAATALARGYGVVTLDVREFSRVPGLEVLGPG